MHQLNKQQTALKLILILYKHLVVNIPEFNRGSDCIDCLLGTVPTTNQRSRINEDLPQVHPHRTNGRRQHPGLANQPDQLYFEG